MYNSLLTRLIVCTSFHPYAAKMTAGYIVGSLVGSFAIAYLCDTFISDKKVFGGECNTVILHRFLKESCVRLLVSM